MLYSSGQKRSLEPDSQDARETASEIKVTVGKFLVFHSLQEYDIPNLCARPVDAACCEGFTPC